MERDHRNHPGACSGLNFSTFRSDERISRTLNGRGSCFTHQIGFNSAGQSASSMESEEPVWSTDSIERFLVGDDSADPVAGWASNNWNDYVLHADSGFPQSNVTQGGLVS